MGKYILVTGGQLYNKGAQAMVFITVDELAKRFPDREIVLVSNMDHRRSAQEKEKYCFRIMRFPRPVAMVLAQTLPGRWWYQRMGDTDTREFLKVLRQSDAMINISGYALGSNWGIKRTIYYMSMIGLARSAHADVYLMPQSFGPFQYRSIFAPFIHGMIRRGLRYPKVVMCREKEGYEFLERKYHLANAVCEPDLVLQNKGIDLRHIYKKEQALCVPVVPQHSVAVIPNRKTLLYGKEQEIYSLYVELTRKLLACGRHIYYVYHSTEDLIICNRLKTEYFGDEERVRVIEQELSCVEFDRFVQQFDYVVASRFHAIVHAYKNGVPAIALGWATKYRELLEMFGQGEYRFDVRGKLDKESFWSAVDQMELRHARISEAIMEKMDVVRKENVYDLIKL